MTALSTCRDRTSATGILRLGRPDPGGQREPSGCYADPEPLSANRSTTV